MVVRHPWVGVITAVLIAAGLACAPKHEQARAKDGLPPWLSEPCWELPKDAICATAESDFAAADVEAAKTDAETAAKNKIAEQLSTRVGRLTERLSSAMKDLTAGRTVGERTVKDINQNFMEREIQGLRYDQYFYWPERMHPEKVYVRAYVVEDTIKMSQDIVGAMATAAMAERLELKHEEAQLRFEEVRRQYLEEGTRSDQ